jgi:aminopeptidase-like protein
MHRWLTDLFPICRSLTGPGVVETLEYVRRILPDLRLVRVASGTQVFDWTVPEEWSIRGGWLEGPDGRRVVDFATNNLHVMGYSTPIDQTLSLDELQPHLHSLPDQPDAIPYVTAYYHRNWAFCLTHRQREALRPGMYRAVIDSTLAPGHLTYGELVIPGHTDREVLLSTYVCHPSMANNELSGPVLATALARSLLAGPKPRLTYRILFMAETIGAITYLSQHLAHLQERLVAGFVLTCVGDERTVSYLESRYGDTLADRVARHVLDRAAPGYVRYPYTKRGSDERQYCSPGIDLPVALVMRSKFGTFPEYHTSLDDTTLVTPTGLAGSYALHRRMIAVLEANGLWKTTCLCEPQLGKRGLFPQTGTKDILKVVGLQMNLLVYCDGRNDLLAIADRLGVDIADCRPVIERLEQGGVLARLA